jgi:uncharacterized membrane protein
MTTPGARRSAMALPLRRHLPFYCGLAGGATAFLSILTVPVLLATVLAANAFFAIYLGLTLSGLRGLTAGYLKANASASDEPVWIIFLVTLAAVVAAIAALFVVVNRTSQDNALSLALALSAVPLGWFTIHVMAALHYAHEYWQPDNDAGQRRRGLAFPGTADPSGMDFVYFSFVTGMTAQTSDVSVTTTRMRRINVVHGIASFFFNTVLVAAAVNIAVSLGP